MAIVVRNTNYNGEVLEKILVLATTGNDLVEKGLIMVIPGVEKKISLPRIKTGKMLQKRKENPTLEDSKGNFNYSEKSLDPEDFMAFTTFNPRAFEHVWRKWQPKGNLVFAELPPEAQNTLLDELSKSVKFELGWHYLNGEFGSDDDHLFNGILTQAAKDPDVIVVPAPSSSSTAAWDSAISTFFSGSASRPSTSVPDTALPLLFTPAVTVREPSVPTAVKPAGMETTL